MNSRSRLAETDGAVDVASRSTRGAWGRLGEALIRLFLRQATVATSEPVGADLHLITLESPQFRSVVWTPGQKLQIAMGSAFVARTFTPVEWDAVAGRTRILAYAHGDGPGSEWIRAVKPGDSCEVFGPRASLDVTGLDGPAVVFGDESSFGLAVAIARRHGSGSVQYLFEMNVAEDARAVLERLGIHGGEVFARMSNDEHLREVEQRLAAAAAEGATFVLTGKGTSIQRLRRWLKTLNVPSARVMARAYWMPGKVGLD